VPTEGCTIEVDAKTGFVTTTGREALVLQIHENASPVGVANGIVALGTDGGGGSVLYVNTAPVPGTTYAYTIGARSDAANAQQGGVIDTIDLGTNLKVVAECGG
jgi:hypothetical protein